MRNARLFRICSSLILTAWLASSSVAFELPSLTVELNTGRKLRATLDARTNVDLLWLRFGSSDLVVQRGFEWHSVTGVREGDRLLSQRELIQLADAARLPPATSAVNAQQRIVVATSSSPSDVAPRTIQRGQPATPRVAAVTFDAALGNWDDDVTMDGLYVQVTATDGWGEPLAVRGVLNVELYSMRRIDQDSAPRGRGRQIGALEKWSTTVECEPENPHTWVRLPFQAVHPEFNIDWAPYGLVHIQLVVPGHGVFHHSVDGLRIRPWSPLSDALQRHNKTRFFPAETGAMPLSW